MSIFLDNVKKHLDEGNIDNKQALYLIFTKYEVLSDIDSEKMLDLVKKGLIVNNRIPNSLLTKKHKKSDSVGSIAPIYKAKFSKDVTAKIARLLCMRDPQTHLVRLPGQEKHEDPIKYTSEKYLDNEELIAYHYIIFLYLFPIKSPYNRKWEKHFNTGVYTGPTIRRRNKGNGRSFIKMAQEKDMGAFLYGTYLFVQSCINGGKAYVKSIDNYMKEYEEWYDIGLAALENAESVDSLFRKAQYSSQGRIARDI